MGPRDPTRVPFKAVQGMVDAIWADMGLKYPPRVDRLPAQAVSAIGFATRLQLRFHEETPSWCILHELAHAMSCTHDGGSDWHGPVFMGLYARMLVRYLRFDLATLRDSLAEAGIAVDFDARPVFLDA